MFQILSLKMLISSMTVERHLALWDNVDKFFNNVIQYQFIVHGIFIMNLEKNFYNIITFSWQMLPQTTIACFACRLHTCASACDAALQGIDFFTFLITQHFIFVTCNLHNREWGKFFFSFYLLTFVIYNMIYFRDGVDMSTAISQSFVKIQSKTIFSYF